MATDLQSMHGLNVNALIPNVHGSEITYAGRSNWNLIDLPVSLD